MTMLKKPYAERISEEFIKSIENGTAPWMKPWEPGTIPPGPINAITERPYQGMNDMLLSKAGYADPRWLTFKQASEIGGKVRKGEKAHTVQFWDWYAPKLDEADNKVLDVNGKPEMIKRDFPRVYYASVFNGQQIENMPKLVLPERTFDLVEKAEQLMEASGLPIIHDQSDRAFYNSSTDEVHLPPQGAFKDATSYYSVALHEIGHATGHETRLARQFGNTHGSQLYAREELRAEIASFMVARDLGLAHEPGRHASYVKSWLKALNNDKDEIFRAARDAKEIKIWVTEPEQRQSLELTAQKRAAEQQARGANRTEQKKTTQPTLAEAKEMATPANEIQKTKSNRIYLAVPFAQKDEAKKLGARWDKGSAKSWYITENQDRTLFAKWDNAQAKAPQSSVSPVQEFSDTLRANGFHLGNEVPKMDGEWHRAAIEGDKGAKKSGAYQGFLDGIPAGNFRNFKTGETKKWIHTGQSLSAEDRAALKAQSAQIKDQRSQERQAQHAKASKIAYGIFNNLPDKANQQNSSYLKAKDVQGYGAKVTDKGELVVPVYNANDRLVNLQFFKDHGKIFLEKAELSGCLHTITGTNGTGKLSDITTGMGGTIILCEGKATGDTLHEATGRPVVAALNADNLAKVAVIIKDKFPSHELIIAADNDHATKINNKLVNVGLIKGQAAAEAVGARMTYPDFTSQEKQQGLTDFNDLAASRGKPAVKQTITQSLSRNSTHQMSMA